MKKFAFAILAALMIGVTAVGMDYKKGTDGLTIDLPTSQHHINTGGSDGAGLCVYTSGQHAAAWQNLPLAEGIHKWMERRPGGSYPEKLDATLKAYFAEKGQPVPPYFQHTGGDEQVLDLLIATRRMPCLTYAGCDDFYGQNGVIAHMVNCLELTKDRGAILDNNRPGGRLEMTRKELIDRWRGVDASGRSLVVRVGVRWMPVGGGWVWGWLAPPPPPKVGPVVAFGCEKCSYCGEDCKCPAGKCPNQCTVKIGQCKNGQCAVPLASEPFGPPPTPDHEWRQFDDGRWGWRFKIEPAKVENQTTWNNGVDSEKLGAIPEYALRGVKCNRTQFIAAVLDVGGLVDDSDKYHLSIVGAAQATPEKYARRLHIQVYAPDSWVAIDRLHAVVTLQEPAKLGGKVVATGSDVAAVCAAVFDPPAPKPEPTPAPQPTPAPAPDSGLLRILLLALAAWLGIKIVRA